MSYDIAIVGSTGAVGREMTDVIINKMTKLNDK